jgi:gas vesicle protein
LGGVIGAVLVLLFAQKTELGKSLFAPKAP